MALRRHNTAPSDIESCTVTTHYNPVTTDVAWSPPSQAPASIQDYTPPPKPTVFSSSLPPRPPKPPRVYPEYAPPPNPTEVHLNIPRAF